jgi:hypothetical protein
VAGSTTAETPPDAGTHSPPTKILLSQTAASSRPIPGSFDEGTTRWSVAEKACPGQGWPEGDGRYSCFDGQ